MADQQDDWALELNSSYSLANFYTSATDAKGGSVHENFRLQAWISESIAQLVASRQIPQYKTKADFFRDAMVHRLSYLEKERGIRSANTTLRRLLANDVLLREEEMMQSLDAQLKSLEDRMAFLIRTGSRTRARELLKRFVQNISGIEDEFWRSRMMNDLANRWPDMMPSENEIDDASE